MTRSKLVLSIVGLAVLAVLLGSITAWVAFEALDAEGERVRVVAAAILGVVLPAAALGNLVAQLWFRVRNEGREELKSTIDFLEKRKENEADIAALETEREASGGFREGSGKERQLAAAVDLRAYLEAHLAQAKLQELAPRGTLDSALPAGEQITRGEIDALRQLLDQSKSATSALDAREWFLRGNAEAEAEQYLAALAAFDRAIELDPVYFVAVHNRAVTLARLDRFEEALAAYDRATALNPNNSNVHAARGVTLGGLDRYEEALAAYDRAIALNPDDSNVHGARGLALFRLERYEEALATYDRAIALDPDDSNLHGARGLALGGLDRYEEALAAYDRAIALNPDDSETRYDHACTLSWLERGSEAMADLAQALDLGYTDCDLLASDEDLAFVRTHPDFSERFAELVKRCRSGSDTSS